jgi:hypothetical protein
MKVNCAFVDEVGPKGKRVAAECSVCGDRFYDQFSDDPAPRILVSGIQLFIDHANDVHHATGGILGGRRGPDQRRACA